MGLLDRDDIWSGGEDLFGRKFLKHLVEEAKAQATLEGIAKKKKKIWLPNDHPVASTSQFKKPQNYFNNGPRDGYVTVSPYSFGGRISRYISALPKITGDPWILETVQHGLSLEFITPTTKKKIPHNAVMNAEQTKICKKEVASLL